MGVNLFWKSKILKKDPFEASGAWHSTFAGARKTLIDTRAYMQWLALDFKTFLTSARLGTLTLSPQNPEERSNFRFHLKYLKMALVLQNHHQDPY